MTVKLNFANFIGTDTAQVEIIMNNVVIKSQKSMNVPGVVFHSKIDWFPLVSKAILQANK